MNPDKVLTAFSQSGKNNCATIGIIKLAIAVYGKDHIFKHVESDPAAAGYTVILHNGKSVCLSRTDPERLSKQSGFKPNPKAGPEEQKEITELANFCFAVIVRYVMDEEKITEKSALHEINVTGINSDYAYRNLGIPEENIRFLTPGNRGTVRAAAYAAEPAYLLYNNNHCVMAVLNRFDEYAEPTDITQFVSKHSSFFKPGRTCWAYTIDG